MKYYLAELFITHGKTWFGWMPYNNRLSIQLIVADNLVDAQEKTVAWADERMKDLDLHKKYKYKAFTTPAI